MPGRNDPCPCGSGKKYKKCCLPRLDSPGPSGARSTAVPPRGRIFRGPPIGREGCNFTPHLIHTLIRTGGRDREIGGGGLAPYTIAQLVRDDRGIVDPALRRAVARHRRGWTVEKVRAMKTEEIEERLRQLGTGYDRERFLTEAAIGYSAWELSIPWTERDAFVGTDLDLDFAGFAACELWRRLLPDRPSMETIDDRMQAGYECAGVTGGEPVACDIWWRLWEILRGRFTPAMRTVDEAGVLFRGTQAFGNWLSDFEFHLENGAARGGPLAEMGRRFCSERIAQFTDEPAKRQASMRCTLATFLFDLARPDEAEAVLEEAVQRWPDSPWPYIYLADECASPRRPGARPDTVAARAWLTRGLLAVGREDRRELERRLADLGQAAP